MFWGQFMASWWQVTIFPFHPLFVLFFGNDSYVELSQTVLFDDIKSPMRHSQGEIHGGQHESVVGEVQTANLTVKEQLPTS